jgi:hypothetical protein
MGTSNQAGARIVEGYLAKYGCLPAAGDGPVIERFEALALADAITQEVQRAGEYGWSKITVHMDVPDALALAKFLRANATRGA